MKTLLEKGTGEATAEFIVGKHYTQQPYVPATLFLVGSPASDDEIKVQFPDETDPDSVDWYDLEQGGSTVGLRPGDTALTLYGPGKYRVSRPSGTNSLGVKVA